MLKTNLNDLFETNTSVEEDGVWQELKPGQRVKIRAFSAKAVVDLREVLRKPYAALERFNKIPDEAMEEISRKVIAGAVIADWEGIMGEDDDGKPVEIPYNADNAYAILKAMPRFGTWVVSVSMDAQNYKDAVREDGAKN
jgi:hypothetical protein